MYLKWLTLTNHPNPIDCCTHLYIPFPTSLAISQNQDGHLRKTFGYEDYSANTSLIMVVTLVLLPLLFLERWKRRFYKKRRIQGKQFKNLLQRRAAHSIGFRGFSVFFVSWIHALVLFIIASVYCCHNSLQKVAHDNSSILYTESWIEITNIAQFMFSFLREKTKLRAKGIMWRIVFIYTFYIFCGVIGLLSCIPCVSHCLDRKSILPFCTSYGLLISIPCRHRSSMLAIAIWLLNIVWILFIILFDMSSVSIKTNTIYWFQKLSSYWLNLLWTLAVFSFPLHSF